MKITHLYSGDDGQSHFRDIELLLTPSGRAFGFEIPGIEGAQLRNIPEGLNIDFHTAPRRQFVIQLEGSGEVDCGNGEVRLFGPGDILLADDLTGRGHLSRQVSAPRRQLLIYMRRDIPIDDDGIHG